MTWPYRNPNVCRLPKEPRRLYLDHTMQPTIQYRTMEGLADIIESFKEDIFTIYREAAVLIRDVHGRNVTPEDVTFFLFTRETPEDSIELNPNNLITLANKNVKIVFFVHGWSNSRKVAWYESLKNAFLRRDDEYYVVQVDWRTPAQEIYPIAAISSYDVATYIEQVIEDLHKKHDIPLDNILLVGHSIGAHIVGFVGEKVYESIGEKLPRIIALDPAGPFFSQRPADKRLNEGHAEVVEVLHTDGGLFGMLTPCGTIDFFANGGRNQPGCIRIDLTDFSSIKESVWCDHHRSHEIFVEAVLNPKEFVTRKCENWSQYLVNHCDKEEVTLGDLNTNLTGRFYFETNKEKPFALKRPGQSPLKSAVTLLLG